MNAVDHLVIKAGRGARARYFNLPRQSRGLELSARAANFLAKMSRSAHLVDVRVATDTALNADAVPQFGQREALYIYSGVSGLRGARLVADAAQDDCLSLIQRLDQALAQPQLPLAEVKELDVAVQSVLATVGCRCRIMSWEVDQRLISIFARNSATSSE